MTSDELKLFIARTLKSAREKAGVTQDEMARMLNVKQPTVNRFESGTANISIETIWKYMNALNVDINFTLYKVRRKQKK